MKTLPLALAVLLVLPLALGGLHATVPDSDELPYGRFELSGASYLQEPGAPQMPYLTRTYAFPAGTTIRDVSVVPRGVTEQSFACKIVPAPPARPLNVEPCTDGWDEGAVYAQDAWYPEEWFFVRQGMGLHRGERAVILSVHLFPVRYNPVRGTGLMAGDFDISIDYGLPAPSVATGADGAYDLLVIAPTPFLDDLAPLVPAKTARNIATVVATLDQINQGAYFDVRGRDDAEKIKYFIKDAVESWGIRYVLLVGDADVMPVRYAATVIGDVPSDLYFADLYNANGSFSSWDADGDRTYGEPDDDPDLYPDVAIGRLPASTDAEVALLVGKIVGYAAPRQRALMTGVELFWDTDEREGEYLKERVSEPLTIPAVKLYETDDFAKNGDATASVIAGFINSGVALVNFAAHGSPYGMGWDGGHFVVDDLYLLHNADLPVVFAMSCSTNRFDDEDCIGEALLLLARGGAIAYAGASRVAYVYLGKGIASGLSGYLDRAFFNAYYDGATAVGNMFAQAKTDYLSNIPFGGDHDDLTVMEYNLLGDPTVGLPAMPMTSKAYTSADVSNQSIRVWVETYEENATIDLYYRRSFVFGGRWNLLGSSDEAPHEWTFMPEQDGAYEFHSVLRSGNYTENAPKVADATCFFDFSVPSVAVVKPERGAAYLFNSKLAPLRRNATVVIGAIDVTVEGDATKVEFYVNGHLMHTAYEVPFV